MRKLITLSLCFITAALAGAWRIEVVDPDADGHCSLALDSNDYPHISYQYIGGDWVLKYAYWNGYEWNIEVADDEYPCGWETSIAIDSNDLPHIAHRFVWAQEGVRYAHWTGSSWIRNKVHDGFPHEGCSIAVDSLNIPHVAFWDGYWLTYAVWDGDFWHSEYIDEVEQETDIFVSVAANSNGNPRIVYNSHDIFDVLKYAYYDGIEWHIVSADFGGEHNSLTVNSNDTTWISFKDGGLRVAYYYNDTWAEFSVDSGGYYSSIEMDENDWPHCSHANSQGLRYSRWNGSDWQNETVDPIGSSCQYTSLELDSNDLPHICYFNDSTNAVMYARYDPNGFHLEEPEKGEVVETTTPLLDWEDSPVPDHESYTLWWGEDPDFDTYNEVTDIGESEYQITDGIKDGDCIYWRVKSIDDQSEECWAAEMDWYFDVDLIYFHLLSPESGEVVDTLTPLLDWEDSPVPDHESYTLWWGTDPDFNDYNEVTGIGESEYQITEGIEDGDRIWWRVKSIDEDEEEYWAVELDWYFDVDTGGGIGIVDFVADAEDEGVLVTWLIEGGAPAGLRVLRSVGDAEPVAIHHNPLPGSAERWLDNQVEAGVEYVYWLEVTEADGTVKRFGPTDTITVPEYIPELILYTAYPNPSRETINFVFSVPAEGRVELSVYDLSGRRIASLVNSDMTAGRHEIVWDCVGVGSGVYLYRLETLAGSITQRLVIAR